MRALVPFLLPYQSTKRRKRSIVGAVPSTYGTATLHTDSANMTISVGPGISSSSKPLFLAMSRTARQLTAATSSRTRSATESAAQRSSGGTHGMRRRRRCLASRSSWIRWLEKCDRIVFA
jgi:hypothetical protein